MTKHSTKIPVHQEDVIVIHIYAQNIRAPKYIKHTLEKLKGKIDTSKTIVGDFNTPPADKEQNHHTRDQ